MSSEIDSIYIQKRASRIIHPDLAYIEAIDQAKLETLYERIDNFDNEYLYKTNYNYWKKNHFRYSLYLFIFKLRRIKMFRKFGTWIKNIFSFSGISWMSTKPLSSVIFAHGHENRRVYCSVQGRREGINIGGCCRLVLTNSYKFYLRKCCRRRGGFKKKLKLGTIS
jgi:hypothetical protein